MRNTFIRVGVDGPTIPSVVYHVNDLKLPGKPLLGRVGGLRVKRGVVNEDGGIYKKKNQETNIYNDYFYPPLPQKDTGGVIMDEGYFYDALVQEDYLQTRFQKFKTEEPILSMNRDVDVDIMPEEPKLSINRNVDVDIMPDVGVDDIIMGDVDLTDELNYANNLLIEANKDKSNSLQIIKDLKIERKALNTRMAFIDSGGVKRKGIDSEKTINKKQKTGHGKVYKEIQDIERKINETIKKKEIEFIKYEKKEPKVFNATKKESSRLNEKDELKRIIRILKSAKTKSKAKDLQILKLENRLRKLK